MSGAVASEARDARSAWIENVLGIAQHATQKSPEAPPSEQVMPFQIFVKSTDGVTMTLTLPERENTLIGDLLVMLEDRTDISWDQQYLTTGTKPVNRQHANLPVAEYGIQPNQTLSLQGRLKGGFGERAAIAETVLKGISHGNVLGDIHQTNGASKAKKDLSRWLMRRKNDDGSSNLGCEQHLAAIVGEAKRLNLVKPGGEEQWLTDNWHFISAVGTTTVQAGNCGDYTQVVYSELMAKTTGQTVYQVVMKEPYDHQFVVTSPNNWNKSIADLASDKDAMVADAWWANRICTFTKFVAGFNPYSKPVTASNLEIVEVGAANGKPFPKAMADFVAKKVEAAQQDHEAIVKDWAHENHLKTKALEEATDKVEQLSKQLSDLKPELQRLEVKAGELDTQQLALTKNIMRLSISLDGATQTVADCNRNMQQLQESLLNTSNKKSIEQATARFVNAISEVEQATNRMQQVEQELLAVKRKLDQVSQNWFDATNDLNKLKATEKQSKVDLQKAEKDRKDARATLQGSFGDVRRPWTSGMDDTRTPQEIYETVILSFRNGGAQNFTDEVARLADREFKVFWEKGKQFKSIVMNEKIPDVLRRAQGLGLS